MTSQDAASNFLSRSGDIRGLGVGALAQSVSQIDPRQMRLAALASRCAVESDHFYRGRPYDSRFAYELFRRALVERDEQAWEHLYAQYGMLVESWVRRSGAFAGSGETSEYFVGAAFTKFWRAVGPERFDTFPTLAALLHYLQLCTGSVVIDSVRSQSWSEMVSAEELAIDHAPLVSPDEQALERVGRLEFWRLVADQLNGEAERVVLLASFVVGLKPGEIYDERPDLFTSVQDVYNVKRNVLCRLSRNTALRSQLA